MRHRAAALLSLLHDHERLRAERVKVMCGVCVCVCVCVYDGVVGHVGDVIGVERRGVWGGVVCVCMYTQEQACPPYPSTC